MIRTRQSRRAPSRLRLSWCPGRASEESRQAAEPLGENLPDLGIFFSGKRPSAVVSEGYNQMHEDVLIQNRSIPNTKSSATVTAADRSSDPRQPSRFEKKKNMIFPRKGWALRRALLTGQAATPP